MSNVTGYDPGKEEKKTPPPEKRNWTIDHVEVGRMDNSETVYASILLDGEVIGSVRLPNNDHLKYLRAKFLAKCVYD